jgi:NADH-quinone oxidoreductase subunit N
MENLNLVLPEIFISLSIMFLLVLGVFKKDSSKITFNISLLVLLIASIITLNETFSINRVTLFNNSVVIDPYVIINENYNINRCFFSFSYLISLS